MLDSQIEIVLKKLSTRKRKQYIRSPLNYTGNKYRILNQIVPYMPSRTEVFVDLFSGGATVGLNINATKVYLVDSNPKVIGLLKTLGSYTEVVSLIKDILKIINAYNLSVSCVEGYSYYKEKIDEKNSNNGLKRYNEEAYYELRDDYNKLKNKNTKNSNLMLYVLMIYAFNNDMRFSKTGDFNLPIGKTDFNLNNVVKLRDFIERLNEIECEFICADFTSEKVSEIIKSATYIYMDPPYLITTAVYNESNKWTNEDEYRLLNFINELLIDDKSFMLSNVLERREKRNEPLYYWTRENAKLIDIIEINYDYRSASYNKKNRDDLEREIILIPRRKNVKHK